LIISRCYSWSFVCTAPLLPIIFYYLSDDMNYSLRSEKTFFMVNFLNEILESTQSNRNASLKVKLIMRGEKENLEVLLDNSKNALNDIACLSMTKVE
jgi:hypothetical protein